MTSRNPQPIVEILSRISAELNDLAQSVDRLHSLVVDAHAANTDKETFLQDAQSIDLIEQRLSNLSYFIDEITGMIPPEWEIVGKAAAQKLKLTALAHRLSAPEGQVHPDHASGEFEMF
jgi:hypothetical protein